MWRLQIEKPELIKLGVDTMVLDNDAARKREGVEPTYKKVKGFQPLQMFWGRYLVDAIFRNGKAKYPGFLLKLEGTGVSCKNT